MNKLFVDFCGTITEFRNGSADVCSAHGYLLGLKSYENVVSAIK